MRMGNMGQWKNAFSRWIVLVSSQIKLAVLEELEGIGSPGIP